MIALYALENQTFDPHKMEVIFVDDASTDQTPKRRKYHPSFELRYIRCDQNIGRSRAKNIGVEAANGEIIIILDAEMILDPDYVKQHYNLHQTNQNLVITGCLNHYNTYTILDKKYNDQQLRKFIHLYRKLNIRSIFKKKTKIRLFLKKDILQRKYKKFAFRAPFFYQSLGVLALNMEGFCCLKFL